MTSEQIERLAAAINALRPDWPRPSLATWLAGNLADRAYRDAALAMVWVALDDATKTPARVLEAGPWWQTSRVAASEPDRQPSMTLFGDLCVTHGIHRDACAERYPGEDCDTRADVAQRRLNAAERYARGAAAAREALRAGRTPEGDFYQPTGVECDA